MEVSACSRLLYRCCIILVIVLKGFFLNKMGTEGIYRHVFFVTIILKFLMNYRNYYINY